MNIVREAPVAGFYA